MTKLQWSVVVSAVALFVALYFGCETKSEKHKGIEVNRAMAAVSTDISALLKEAKIGMTSSQSSSVLALEVDLNEAATDSSKAEVYKQLSSLWYRMEKPGIAGFYAEKVAETFSDEEAWSIAGTTYSICVQREKVEKVKKFCAERGIQALEKAISLNPANPQHKINLALVYAEVPVSDNPMQGILMLLDLNKQFPKNVPVIIQIGRMGMNTGQYEKAAERFEEALHLEPDNMTAICLLAETYEQLEQSDKAAMYREKCTQTN